MKSINSSSYTPDILIERFIEALRAEDPPLSQNTLDTYRSHLVGLDRRFQARHLTLANASSIQIESDIAQRSESGIKANSLAGQFASYRRFYQHLTRKGITGKDPTAKIMRPKSTRHGEQQILGETEVDMLLSASVPSTPMEHRDHTILRVIYTTGIRSSELINLTMDRIDLHRGTISVMRREKQKEKEKICLLPLGEAKDALKRFVDLERGGILLEKTSEYVFPSRRGDKMTRQALWSLLRTYGEKTGSTQVLSQQILRRMFLLRKNGPPPEQKKLALGTVAA